jgi:hypothetical protein
MTTAWVDGHVPTHVRLIPGGLAAKSASAASRAQIPETMRSKPPIPTKAIATRGRGRLRRSGAPSGGPPRAIDNGIAVPWIVRELGYTILAPQPTRADALGCPWEHGRANSPRSRVPWTWSESVRTLVPRPLAAETTAERRSLSPTVPTPIRADGPGFHRCALSRAESVVPGDREAPSIPTELAQRAPPDLRRSGGVSKAEGKVGE